MIYKFGNVTSVACSMGFTNSEMWGVGWEGEMKGIKNVITDDRGERKRGTKNSGIEKKERKIKGSGEEEKR